MTFLSRKFLFSLFLIFSFSIFSCGGPQEIEVVRDTESHPPRARYQNLAPNNHTQETSDINRDGNPDQFRYFNSQGQMVWEERDIDWDGRVDMYVYFNTEGEIVEQAFQLDFDDAIDVIRFYEDGHLVRKELTSGFSNFIGIVKHYGANGELLRVEHDLNHDGQFDLWE